jgi:S-adenosylmethionine:tRNA ribosyltransferase-isomerase
MLLNKADGGIGHYSVRNLPSLIEAQCGSRGALMVFNNSRVRKARIYGINEKTGIKKEFLLITPLAKSGAWTVMLKAGKHIKTGARFIFPQDVCGEIAGEAGSKIIEFSPAIDDEYLNKYGHIPLPMYIKREDTPEDTERYQTIYSKDIGSIAAPTAGLHFTNEIFNELNEKNIDSAFITLHVGLGTFKPVRSENIEDHIMHTEYFSIDDNNAKKIEEAKESGRKIIAIGTTTVRTLEAAYKNGKLQRGENSTNIFIYGEYKFNVVDLMFTNFHTPESTLLMLTSSFCGNREMILNSYRIAIENKYKFFSYGDAMLIV